MADVTIDAGLYAGTEQMAARGGVFWTSPLIGYVIYVDASIDLKYRKTTDGGANWSEVNLLTGNVLAFDSWADWQTPGDAGTVIHIACIDADTDDVLYFYIDTSDDSTSSDKIEDCQGTGAFDTGVLRGRHGISITKAKGGNLAVSFYYMDSGAALFYGFYTSPDADTWTSKTNPREINTDHLLLFPGNEADNQDVWAVYWDVSINVVSLKTFDDSGNSWSERSFEGADASTTYLQMDGAIRHSDGHLVFAVWTNYNNALADLAVWDINGAASITQKTNVITDTAEYALVSVFINQANDDIYVAYAGGTDFTTLVKVFYQKSDDGGGSWGGQTAMQADAEDDEKWISCGAMKKAWGGMFLPVWYNDDLYDLFCNTDNGISIAAEGVLHEKSLSDTVTISDSIMKTASLNKADSVSVSDSIVKSMTLVKDDTVTISDSFARIVSYVRALADTVVIADTLSKTIGLVKADTMAIADTFSRTVSYVRSLADNVGITDSISKTVSIIKADAVVITDAMTALLQVIHAIHLSDIVTITDRLVGELRVKTYLKQRIARMQIKGIGIARMSINKMGIARMPLFRWIIRRWTA